MTLIAVLLLTLRCADSIPPPHESQFQSTLMNRVFENLSLEGMLEISKDYQRKRYCTGWYGISCGGYVLVQVTYMNFQRGNFNIAFLPHPTHTLQIVDCKQDYELKTRLLPRNLVRLCLSFNSIYGHLDLTELPSKLMIAYLNHNHLTGPIDLTRLPGCLETLQIHRNLIDQDVVWYDNLPEFIIRIELNDRENQNTIGEVRARDPKKVANWRIFQGMPKKRIH